MIAKPYRSVDLEQAEEGMQLFEQVRDRQGNVLLPAGAELTAALIRSLQRRGIESVLVEGDALSAEALEQAREQVVQRLDQLFGRSRGRASEELRRAVLAYRMESLS